MPRSINEILALIGQVDFAGGTMKQPDPEVLLQLRDLSGDRRLAAVAFASDRGERASFDDADKGLQSVYQIHHLSRICCRFASYKCGS